MQFLVHQEIGVGNGDHHPQQWRNDKRKIVQWFEESFSYFIACISGVPQGTGLETLLFAFESLVSENIFTYFLMINFFASPEDATVNLISANDLIKKNKFSISKDLNFQRVRD